jgi:hypothetical protein
MKNMSILTRAPRQFILTLFIISALAAIYSLRHNNLTMVKLRNAVYAADKNNGDVNTALNDLRRYVYGHMNTDLSSGGNAIKPPIQLKYTYERLQSAAEATANNAGLYTEAENYCQAKIPASVSISGRGRIECVQEYILSHGGKKAPEIPSALYQFDFVSPTWSPDLAGWSLLATAVFFLSFIVKLAFDKVFSGRSKRQP